ncbi:cyclic nucleotide-binding domain-containing protein [SAR92 clade bacterium H455]|uniref:Cyclic nucleotide-binding domain-containing protein n=1 Tax=SAR92 clade bacterium H455 TaxID=2974818 RepID=A0ABY5TKE3_9GAMM|nr:cyclic nucleotide-binding domain-containing protein [SAR92 clade bacterium H455]
MESLLPTLGGELVSSLIPFLESVDVENGRVLVSQGAEGSEIYFLLGGMFTVFEKIKINGSSVILNTASFPGPSLLGEVNVLNETTRSATVVAIEGCQCFVLSQGKFDQIVSSNPKLAIQLLKAFGAIVSARSANFQNRVRGNILNDSRSIEAAIHKLGRYTGKVSRADDALDKKLFSADLESVSYISF